MTGGAAAGQQDGQGQNAKQKPAHGRPVVTRMISLPHSLTFEKDESAEDNPLFTIST
jgi:hypothetical protein